MDKTPLFTILEKEPAQKKGGSQKIGIVNITEEIEDMRIILEERVMDRREEKLRLIVRSNKDVQLLVESRMLRVLWETSKTTDV